MLVAFSFVVDPAETAIVQRRGLAEGDRVDFDIEEPQAF